MKVARITTIICISISFLSESLFAQYFGKNKVQYTNFDWRYLQSEHFDIYFTSGGLKIASFVADVAEAAYQNLRTDFNYDLIDRITVIVHSSHNDFEQTNVDLQPPEEAVGGFTEFFKNRVVIPYEGNWEKLRHVIHHELTHAVMLQMIYGTGVQSIISGMSRLQLPLWFIEGLAEYESLGWDLESDMYMRDATLNGFLPGIEFLSGSGFMTYKGGQSVLYYLAEKYDTAKIGEILRKIKLNKSIEHGFKKAIGVTTKELSEGWHKYLKTTYWPEVGNRKEPKELGMQLTDHTKWSNFTNNNPALNPKGDKIAFLSDKSDYFDIYLMSAVDGKILTKLVTGQRSGDLEELHWLKGPSISWSPDGNFIVFTARSGGVDELKILNVETKKIVQRLGFELDGLSNPCWNPKKSLVAFMGMKKGQSDIYYVNLETGALTQLTDDIFSDIEPSWSPDGLKLVFSSDRCLYLDPSDLSSTFSLRNHNYKNYDIYELDIRTQKIKHLIADRHGDRTPIYSPDGKFIAFVSERSGINNIYLYCFETGVEWPITNILTSALQPSWKGNRMAFTSFYKSGFDIYLLKNPSGIKAGEIQLEKTELMKKLDNQLQAKTEPGNDPGEILVEHKKDRREKFHNYIFDKAFVDGKLAPDEKEAVELGKEDIFTQTGDFKVCDYKVKFSPDIVNGYAGYDQYFGIQGSTQLSFSDVMGDHRINFFTNMFYDLRNSDYMISYLYLPYQIDFGVGGHHNAYFFWLDSSGIIRDRNWGGNLLISRPFNRYQRIDLGLAFLGIDRSFLETNMGTITRRLVSGSLSYVKDTSFWDSAGPINGTRSAYGITYTPALWDKNGIDFITIRMDHRKYLKISKSQCLAVRFASAISGGGKPQQFFLGGVSNWINRTFLNGIRVKNLDDVYFSSFEMPLRGANYYQLEGNRFALVNIEYRFPLIHYLLLGWPSGFGFQNVRGAIFADLGTACNYHGNSVPHLLKRNPSGGLMLDESIAFMGYGFSIRTFVGWFLLNIDFVWPTDLYHSGASKIYWSIGAAF